MAQHKYYKNRTNVIIITSRAQTQREHYKHNAQTARTIQRLQAFVTFQALPKHFKRYKHIIITTKIPQALPTRYKHCPYTTRKGAKNITSAIQTLQARPDHYNNYTSITNTTHQRVKYAKSTGQMAQALPKHHKHYTHITSTEHSLQSDRNGSNTTRLEETILTWFRHYDRLAELDGPGPQGGGGRDGQRIVPAARQAADHRPRVAPACMWTLWSGNVHVHLPAC